MKAEMEMAMKLLEKDVHEKQDTIIALRNQLEDIKNINLEMYTKLQVMYWKNLVKGAVLNDFTPFAGNWTIDIYINTTIDNFILGMRNRNKPERWTRGQTWGQNTGYK